MSLENIDNLLRNAEDRYEERSAGKSVINSEVR